VSLPLNAANSKRVRLLGIELLNILCQIKMPAPSTSLLNASVYLLKRKLKKCRLSLVFQSVLRMQTRKSSKCLIDAAIAVEAHAFRRRQG
jgi:hypothetical protein